MCNYVLFWISYLLSALQWIWILKRFFCDTWSRAWKTRSESRETNNPPYVENNYRIEVKITFMLIAYLVLLCEFFWEFSIFHFCRPLVDIYWHPHLKTKKALKYRGHRPPMRFLTSLGLPRGHFKALISVSLLDDFIFCIRFSRASKVPLFTV